MPDFRTLFANHRRHIYKPGICAACACTASTNTIATSSPIIIFIIVIIFLNEVQQADNCVGLPLCVINVPIFLILFYRDSMPGRYPTIATDCCRPVW